MKNLRHLKRKLNLDKESVRRLSGDDLPKAVGGADTHNTICVSDCAASTCVTGCQTCQTCYRTCLC